MRILKSGGGWQAVRYSLRKAKQVGFWNFWKALRSKNACKTCALGMGGQRGGMVNEGGSWPEVCKKSMQAIASDLQGGIKAGFWKTYSIPQMQKFTPYDLEHCGRLVHPVILRQGSQYYETISWDEAFQKIIDKLKSLTAEQTYWYFSGRSSNEASFLLQLFARIYGTNNVNNCSFYCHQASGVGMQSSLGTGTATINLEDLEHADLVFLIGGNPASNHPRMMTSLMHVRKRGGKVIVINPVVETGLVNFKIPSHVMSMLFGSEIASQYIQPHIGGDLALLTGIAKRIVELGAADFPFMKEHANNHEAWIDHLKKLEWSEILAKSGCTKEDIDQAAETYSKAKSVIFSWTMGITHHVHGVENVQAIANLAILRGMVGRPHSGLLPIRGHSNVQGIGSMGVTPKLKETIFEKLEKEYGVKLPQTPGRDTLACMDGSLTGELKFGFCLGGNLYGSNPDAEYAAKSLAALDMVVYLNTTMNTGHAHGLAKETIILPVLARDEEPSPTTQESMFNFVRLSDGGPARHQGPLSEVQIVSRIADGVLGSAGPIDWAGMRETGKIREAISKVVPGFEQLATIAQTKKEFQIPGRTFHAPKFPTADGKANLYVHNIPELLSAPGQLRLMTVRSEGQFNTVVYEVEDLYRGQDRRDIVLMHPDDITAFGLKPDGLVDISNSTGVMKKQIVRSFPKIKPGNVLVYYPEANVLVPRDIDQKSRTPAFKNILVKIEPSKA